MRVPWLLGALAAVVLYINVPSVHAQPEPVPLPSDRVADEWVQMPCFRTGAYAKWLQNNLGEQIRAHGMSGPRLVLLMVAEHGGWSILVVDIRGRTCVFSGGSDWTPNGDP